MYFAMKMLKISAWNSSSNFTAPPWCLALWDSETLGHLRC